jgi:hypothetical protein
MIVSPPKKYKNLSLWIFIISGMCAAFLLFSLGLLVTNFSSLKNEESAKTQLGELAQLASSQITNQIKAFEDLSLTITHLLADFEPSNSPNILGKILQSNPSLNALTFGSADGTFLSLDRLSPEGIPKVDEPLPEAAIYGLRIALQGGKQNNLTVMNKDFETLKIYEGGHYIKNPQEYKWFKRAIESRGDITSSPFHILHNSHKMGLTFSSQLKSNQTDAPRVLALDFTLEGIKRSLDGINPNKEKFIYLVALKIEEPLSQAKVLYGPKIENTKVNGAGIANPLTLTDISHSLGLKSLMGKLEQKQNFESSSFFLSHPGYLLSAKKIDPKVTASFGNETLWIFVAGPKISPHTLGWNEIIKWSIPLLLIWVLIIYGLIQKMRGWQIWLEARIKCLGENSHLASTPNNQFREIKNLENILDKKEEMLHQALSYVPKSLQKQNSSFNLAEFSPQELIILTGRIPQLVQNLRTKNLENSLAQTVELWDLACQSVTAEGGFFELSPQGDFISYFEKSPEGVNKTIHVSKQILTEAKNLNIRNRHENKTELKVNLSITYGQCFAGPIKTQDQTFYSLMGRPVSLGQKILELHKIYNHALLVDGDLLDGMNIIQLQATDLDNILFLKNSDQEMTISLFGLFPENENG